MPQKSNSSNSSNRYIYIIAFLIIISVILGITMKCCSSSKNSAPPETYKSTQIKSFEPPYESDF